VESAQTEQAIQTASASSQQKVNLEDLIQAVDQLENVAKLANRSVHFKINESGDDVQVLVINEDTDEVIREIPPDAVLELAERIQGTLGLLIDKVA
jgi:flagellar protein FlaG